MHDDWGERAERWQGIRSEIVDVRGTSVHLLRADGNEDGPVQLLIHGLGGNATNWLEAIPALASYGPVVAPDLPGFGRTEPPRRAGSRIRANVGFLHAFAEKLGIERAIVHGNSMGGLIAVLLAAMDRDLVERLVLVDPALPGPRTQLYRLTPQTLMTFAPFAVPRLGRRVIGRMYATRTAEQLFDDNQHFVHADPTRIRPELMEIGRANTAFGQTTPWSLDGFVTAAESLVSELIAPRSVWRAVEDIDMPTLMVWGDHDQLIGRQVIDGVVKRRADWTLHVFEGVGHAPMAEVPDEFVEVVTRWYRRTEDGADDPVDPVDVESSA